MFSGLLVDCKPGQHVPSEVLQSTRSHKIPDKNVCRECARLITLDNGVWIVDKSRERELDDTLRMFSGL